jgi:hypothetical protein
MRYYWIIMIVLIAVGLTACSSGGGGSSHADMHSVVYEVSSSYLDSNFMISYVDENGETVELPNQYVKDEPWRYSFHAKTGTHLYLYVKPLNNYSEMYYVTIHVDSMIASTTSERGADTAVAYIIPAD